MPPRSPPPRLWQTSPYGDVDAAVVDGLERAVAPADGAPAAERALLVGALADAVYYEPDRTRSLARSSEAVDWRGRPDDPDTLVLP